MKICSKVIIKMERKKYWWERAKLVPCTTTIFRMKYTRWKIESSRVEHKYFLLRIRSCYPGLCLPPLFFTQQLYNGEQKLNSMYNNKSNTVQYRSFSWKRLLVYPFYTYRYFPFLVKSPPANLTAADHRA